MVSECAVCVLWADVVLVNLFDVELCIMLM